jgi:hypothetical protein
VQRSKHRRRCQVLDLLRASVRGEKEGEERCFRTWGLGSPHGMKLCPSGAWSDSVSCSAVIVASRSVRQPPCASGPERPHHCSAVSTRLETGQHVSRACLVHVVRVEVAPQQRERCKEIGARLRRWWIVRCATSVGDGLHLSRTQESMRCCDMDEQQT